MSILNALPENCGIIICGHGSRAKIAEQEFSQLVSGLRARCPNLQIEYGFLEYSSPNIHMALDRVLEASHELGAVIFDPEARRFRRQLTQGVKGDGSLLASLGGGGEGDSEAGMRIDEGEQAAAQSIAQVATVSQANTSSGGCLPPLGLRVLRLRLSGLWRPRALSLVGTWRILFGSRAMMRPRVDALGSSMSCRLHQDRSKTCSLALPRLGNCSRSWRISLISAGGRSGLRFRLDAQDLAVRAAGLPPAWRRVCFQR